MFILDNTYIVYKHQNLINNKIYIGITIYGDKPEKRWRSGRGYEENEKFFSDIICYGWNNFSHEILEKELSLSEAVKKEVEYISFFESTDPEKGYNISPGGSAISSQGREILSKKLTGIKRKPESI